MSNWITESRDSILRHSPTACESDPFVVIKDDCTVRIQDGACIFQISIPRQVRLLSKLLDAAADEIEGRNRTDWVDAGDRMRR